MCKSCERAGATCLYERTLRPQYPGGKSLYITALEERIAFLEARLPAYAEDHFKGSSSSDQQARSRQNEEPISKPSPAGSRHSQGGSISEDVELEEHSLVDGVAYLSLCASGTTDTAPEPFYLGSSSGATIARMIQTSIFHSSGGRAISQAFAASREHQPSVMRPVVALPTAPLSVASDDYVPSEFPAQDQAQLLFDVFFDRMHTCWPLLDRKVYTLLFARQYDQGALSIMQRSIMHLIYAISARFLQLTRKPCGIDPEKHLIAAIEPMDYILEQHNLATVQFLLLLAVHGQRSPYGAGAWGQVRYAVSVCIELGLHRKRTGRSSMQDPRDLEIRKRVFWSCYCLDRVTSVVLGRAFAIADRDINCELPSSSPDFWDLTHKSTAPDTSSSTVWSNIEPFIHIIQLKRIQSRIHRTVFRVDKDVFAGVPADRLKLDRKMATIRDDLDDWARTIPHPPKDAKHITWMYDPESAYHDSRDFFTLQYHKGLLALFTVLLPTLAPQDARFLTCARSAASVCTAYKRLNQQGTLSYTMVSLHSCFVAGLTLVYCLWRDRGLWGYDALEATRACSRSLTIFGEKWPGAVKYRDIFDALSGSLLRTIVDPGQGTGVPLRVDVEGEEPLLFGKNEQRQTAQADKPGISHMVSDAVKEAFMEVDEEAPGGWQGWRMWNEMVKDEGEGAASRETGDTWDGYDDSNRQGGAYYDIDPVQMGGQGMDSSGWEFGVLS
ncbi:hypothetical protein ACHAQA_006283 [Verticillium albo-atrum]